MNIKRRPLLIAIIFILIVSFTIALTKYKNVSSPSTQAITEGQEIKINGTVVKNSPWEKFEIRTGKDVVGWDTLAKDDVSGIAVKCKGGVNGDALRVYVGDYIEVYGKVINGHINTCSDKTDKYYVKIITPARREIDPNSVGACKTSDLKAEFFGEPVMAGGFAGGLRFYNISSTPCSLGGIPNIEVTNVYGRKVNLDITKKDCSQDIPEDCDSNQKVVVIPTKDQKEDDIPQGNALVDLWWTTYEVDAYGKTDIIECPILGLSKISFKVQLPGGNGEILITDPDESQPFIGRICDGIEVGSFVGI